MNLLDKINFIKWKMMKNYVQIVVKKDKKYSTIIIYNNVQNKWRLMVQLLEL